MLRALATRSHCVATRSLVAAAARSSSTTAAVRSCSSRVGTLNQSRTSQVIPSSTCNKPWNTLLTPTNIKQQPTPVSISRAKVVLNDTKTSSSSFGRVGSILCSVVRHHSNVLCIRRAYSTSVPAEKIRNVAIIAHVDHGKTTLVDKLLAACGAADKLEERAMDHNQLEKERGITILSKATAVDYRDGFVINIVDTPGHGDFGGEVERVLCMVDGVVLLVDANEGVMTQTKFVLMKALKKGLPAIVVLNKMDSPMMDAAGDDYLDQVETSIFDLFALLDASDAQLDYPTLYASGKHGWVVKKNDYVKGVAGTQGMIPLFETIIERIPPPKAASPSDPFSMLVSTIDHDDHLGRILIGRIVSGTIKTGDPIKGLDREGKQIETGAAVKLIARRGLSSVYLSEASAGHIVGVAGLTSTSVTSTVCSPSVVEPVPADPIDPAVISMTIGVNDSPLCGKDSDGSKMTMGHISNRLNKELQSNVSLQVHRTPGRKDKLEVHGRGELQLGILIETMRREGFELSVSPPEVLYKTDENGRRLEPIEELIIDVDSEFTGAVIDILANRKGDLVQMKPGTHRTRLEFYAPSRALIGLRSELNTETRGTATVNTIFHEYAPFKGSLNSNRRGALISSEQGLTTSYALQPLEARGILFVGPGTPVYTGMVVGENSRSIDLDVNPVKSKALTNFRTVLKDDNVRLAKPRFIGLEEAIATVREDELIEVTPKAIRLRKAILDPNIRAKQYKAQKKQ